MQPVLQHLVDKRFLEVMHLAAPVLDLARGRLAGGIPRKPLLAGFQELLRPAVVEALGDPFPAAQLGDAVLAAQVREHNPDLLFSRIFLARLAPDIHAYVRQGETRFVRLSSRLSDILTSIERTPLRLRVRGSPGCGKTVIARRFFQEAVERSRKPLLVCFNRQLMERIRASVGRGGLVETWYGLCHRFLESIDEAPGFSRKDSDAEFWSRIQDQVMAARIPESWMFDTIIVDEGQDFEPDWFDILNLFARDDAAIVWLEDPHQAMRTNDPVVLEGFVGFNYRSPESIVRFIKKALPFEFEQANDLPGLGVGVHAYEDDRHQVRLVSRTVSKLLVGKFEPQDIVILSMRGIENTCFGDRARVGNHTLKRFAGGYDLLGNQVFTPGQLHLESIYRYKGQQAPAINAVDVDSRSRDEERMQRILHTAFSRATVRLDVLVKSGDTLEKRLFEAAV